MKEKLYRYFYHYNKQHKKMTVHFRGTCYITKNVTCNVPCETKWNMAQPNLVMRGWASSIQINEENIVIN